MRTAIAERMIKAKKAATKSVLRGQAKPTFCGFLPLNKRYKTKAKEGASYKRMRDRVAIESKAI